ncbi:Ig-like domain-containing protein [Crassaminicella indica]|uniref:Ig-like domain-containing protein n=1 Tax=Crassaminicella indica TaxID=2855394 RepID=A0ABX8R9X3_9CLOT|nr:Ig-like domain-containing protein [Crassaminicella indica]QXM05259.1 Ig-like domain-containing protein [Crassaminicella indica]
MRYMKKLLAFSITFCIIFSISITPVLADKEVKKATIEDVEKAIDMTLNYYKTREQINNDWEAFAINAVGEDVEDKYGTSGKTYLTLLEEEIRKNGVGGQMTDYERRVLGIVSAGGDPTNFAGIDLIDKIISWPDLSQGINAPIFGLIALDASNAIVYDGAKHTRESFIEYILNHMSGDGWNYNEGDIPDPDMTAMALYALAPYKNRPRVKEAGEKAIKWLSEHQLNNGGYKSWGTINSESCAQVICGLTAWGIDPQGPDFTKKGGNVVTAFLDFQVKEGKQKGQFMHVKEYGADPGMATQQALYALAALKDYMNKGKSSIFYKIISNSSGSKEITALEIYPDRLELETGKTFKLGVRNQNNRFISNDNVEWMITNKDVATINEHGVLHTLNSGKTNIIVNLKDHENIRDMIEINVIRQDFKIEKIKGCDDSKTNKNVELKITNISDEEKDAVCIVGLYDKDTHQLIQMNYISKKFLPHASHYIKAGFDIPEEGNYEIKVVVWDNWNNRRPLDEAVIQ